MNKAITSPVEMEAFGARLASAMVNGGVVYLSGPLGAGKTTLARGFIGSLGHRGAVKSPTYTIVEPYQLSGREVYHFDLYRVRSADELEEIGIRDYFAEYAICLVEWPEQGQGVLPAADIVVTIAYRGDERVINVEACTAYGGKILAEIL